MPTKGPVTALRWRGLRNRTVRARFGEAADVQQLAVLAQARLDELPSGPFHKCDPQPMVQPGVDGNDDSSVSRRQDRGSDDDAGAGGQRGAKLLREVRSGDLGAPFDQETEGEFGAHRWTACARGFVTVAALTIALRCRRGIYQPRGLRTEGLWQPSSDGSGALTQDAVAPSRRQCTREATINVTPARPRHAALCGANTNTGQF